MTEMTTPFLSVIVPAYLADAELARDRRRELERDRRVEVIIVDGSCRGRQMNRGAAKARGTWLLFLHADTTLPSGWIDEVVAAAGHPEVIGGSFTLRIDSPSRWARWIERGVAARVRWLKLPYGDQAFFVRRDVFATLGGFREMPLMEDVDFARRLRRAGQVHHSRLAVTTSARRWERDGWFRRTAENAALLALYSLGFPVEPLARLYRK